MTSATLRLRPLPELFVPGPVPEIAAGEYDRRIRETYAAAACDWVLVYADREHTANLTWLTHFDPRFEEALLLLGPNNARVLVLGNEGMGYTSQDRSASQPVLAQSLGLMGQDRSLAPKIEAVLRTAGISADQRVGVIGWKYFDGDETDDAVAPAFVPAFVVRVLSRIVGARGNLIDVTPVLMHPVHGLRARNSAAQIAAFEWAACHASNTVQRVLRGVRPGMREADAAAQLFQHPGLPYICHPMLVAGGRDGPVVGLRSPGERVLQHGDGITCALGFWGALSCRAGLLRAEPDAGFVEKVAAPYFAAVATWWQTLRVGVSGDALHAAVFNQIAAAGVPWRPALNPGHLISIDEWMHTPIRPGSDDVLASGMALQCDIIPAPLPNGWCINCEDGVALADAALRAELRSTYPDVWSRIEARRAWMRDCAGLVLSDDVLPLSNGAGALAPFWLAAGHVMTLV